MSGSMILNHAISSGAVRARLLWLLAALSIFQPRTANTQVPNRYDSFRFGVCYYPEQWPENYWEQDATRMQECGVNTVRLGEFGWALMEPREGYYDFSLFDRAIETLARHGIKTIFGTPTAQSDVSKAFAKNRGGIGPSFPKQYKHHRLAD
jgi:hypothetical protein